MGSVRDKQSPLPLHMSHRVRQKRQRRLGNQGMIRAEMRRTGETRGEVIAKLFASKAKAEVERRHGKVAPDAIDYAKHRGNMRNIRRDDTHWKSANPDYLDQRKLEEETARRRRVAAYLAQFRATNEEK